MSHAPVAPKRTRRTSNAPTAPIAPILIMLLLFGAASSLPAQTRLRLPPDLFAAGQAVAGQAPTPAAGAVTTGICRASRVADARRRGQTRAREQPRHRRPAHRPADLRRRHRQHPFGLQPDASTRPSARQTSKNASTSTISGAADRHRRSTTARCSSTARLAQDVPWGGGASRPTLDNRRQTTTIAERDDQPAVQPDVVGAVHAAAAARLQDRYDAAAAARHPHQSGHLRHPAAADHDQHRSPMSETRIGTSCSRCSRSKSSRQSLSLAEELLRNNQTKVEIGTMAPIDVVQAQAQVAQQRQTLVTAEGTQRTAEIALKRLIVSGTSDPLWTSTIEPVDRPDFRPEPIDLSRPRPRARCRPGPTCCRRARTSRRTTSRFATSRTRSCRRSICRPAMPRPASAAPGYITRGQRA